MFKLSANTYGNKFILKKCSSMYTQKKQTTFDQNYLSGVFFRAYSREYCNNA